MSGAVYEVFKATASTLRLAIKADVYTVDTVLC